MPSLDDQLKPKQDSNIIEMPQEYFTGYIAPILIPPEGLIAYIVNHSKKLVAFMPVFEDTKHDPDIQNLQMNKVAVPKQFIRSIIK